MSDFFYNLIHRHSNTSNVVGPRRKSLFEPRQDTWANAQMPAWTVEDEHGPDHLSPIEPTSHGRDENAAIGQGERSKFDRKNTKESHAPPEQTIKPQKKISEDNTRTIHSAEAKYTAVNDPSTRDKGGHQEQKIIPKHKKDLLDVGNLLPLSGNLKDDLPLDNTNNPPKPLPIRPSGKSLSEKPSKPESLISPKTLKRSDSIRSTNDPSERTSIRPSGKSLSEKPSKPESLISPKTLKRSDSIRSTNDPSERTSIRPSGKSLSEKPSKPESLISPKTLKRSDSIRSTNDPSERTSIRPSGKSLSEKPSKPESLISPKTLKRSDSIRSTNSPLESSPIVQTNFTQKNKTFFQLLPDSKQAEILEKEIILLNQELQHMASSQPFDNSSGLPDHQKSQTIKIHIGRIEIKAERKHPEPIKKRASNPPKPVITLDQFLKSRE